MFVYYEYYKLQRCICYIDVKKNKINYVCVLEIYTVKYNYLWDLICLYADNILIT